MGRADAQGGDGPPPASDSAGTPALPPLPPPVSYPAGQSYRPHIPVDAGRYEQQAQPYASSDYATGGDYRPGPQAWGSTPGYRLGGKNSLLLVGKGDKGYFFVDGLFISTLDLSAKLDAGNISVGTGFFTGAEIVGEATSVSGFSVGRLP